MLCIDEATANVDLETDTLLQEVLRTSLADRTVITIAHRIDTIMESDRVIVISAGSAIEIGNPRELLEDPDSAFYNHTLVN